MIEGRDTRKANAAAEPAERAGAEDLVRAANAALRESEERFRSLYRSMIEGVCIQHLEFDDAGHPANYRIDDVNPQYEKILSLRREDVVGRLATEVYGTPTPPYLAEFSSVVGSGEPYQFETYFPPMDTWFAISVTWMGGDRFATIFFDITERKRAADALERSAMELARSSEELRRSNEEVKQFAYIVSHDLRTPLVNFQGFAAELRRAVTELDGLVRPALETMAPERRRLGDQLLHHDIPESLGFIDAAVTRMDHLINALLRLSRIGRRELVPEPLDLDELVAGTLDSLASIIDERAVAVTVHPLPGITADRVAAEQILGNILTNAVLYLDPDRPGRIEIDGETTAAEVILRVRDNGRGIAEQSADKVFAPFRRAGPIDVPGEGMGLAYVQALVRRHGGRIWFDSQVGVGSTFSVALPRERPSQGG